MLYVHTPQARPIYQRSSSHQSRIGECGRTAWPLTGQQYGRTATPTLLVCRQLQPRLLFSIAKSSRLQCVSAHCSKPVMPVVGDQPLLHVNVNVSVSATNAAHAESRR